MRLRARLALLMLGIVAVFAGVTAMVSFSLTESSLYGATDASLEASAAILRVRPPADVVDRIRDQDRDGRPFPDVDENLVRLQQFDTDGELVFGDSDIPLPAEVLDAATTTPSFRLVEIDGREFRVMTVLRDDDGTPIQAATTTEPIAAALQRLRTNTIIAVPATLLAAAAVGWFIAGRFIRPITEVSGAYRHLAETSELPEPIASTRSDEIGDLVHGANALVEALRESDRRQDRLVSDASHELRTPLTSLRMKMDFLNNESDLPDEQRIEIVRAAALEVESLTELVTELVTLARRSPREDPIAQVSLRDLATASAERTRAASGRDIEVLAAEEALVTGNEVLLRRAIASLVDNAVKYSPEGSPIEILVTPNRVEVRDHGSGISPSDRERVFDRFYRSPEVHDTPGSGIGLAIVHRVARDHGGDTWVRDAPGGGAIVGFSVSANAAPLDS